MRISGNMESLRRGEHRSSHMSAVLTKRVLFQNEPTPLASKSIDFPLSLEEERYKFGFTQNFASSFTWFATPDFHPSHSSNLGSVKDWLSSGR
jgi:hypothetical protein